jgi:hypothetical protein
MKIQIGWWKQEINTEFGEEISFKIQMRDNNMNKKHVLISDQFHKLPLWMSAKAAIKMEEVCSSETLAPICKSTRRYNPEDYHERKKKLP